MAEWRNWVRFPEGTEIFLLIAANIGGHLASFSMGTSGSFSESKPAEREDEHSHPFSADSESKQNSRVYATTPSRVFIT
jgi:hypothetical protein